MEGYQGLSQAWMEQITLLSSIIGGFSLAIAIELLAGERRRERIASVLITVFIIASSLLLISTSVGSQIVVKMSIVADSEMKDVPDFLLTYMPIFGRVIANLYYVGLTFFMIGLGLTGWLHSRTVGIITSATAVLVGGTMIVMLYLIR